MVSKSFVVANKTGVHLRPAQAFVSAMSKYPADITLRCNGRAANGKSMLHMLTVGLQYGSRITVECSGAQEEAMLTEAGRMIENGFGELS